MNTEAMFVRMLFDQLRGRTIRARRLARDDLGASAIEWAIISAIVVGLAIVVMKVVTDVVKNNEDKIREGNNT